MRLAPGRMLFRNPLRDAAKAPWRAQNKSATKLRKRGNKLTYEIKKNIPATKKGFRQAEGPQSEERCEGRSAAA